MFFSPLTNNITLHKPLYYKFTTTYHETWKVTALTLLDLSADFDTIDYSVLLDHLSDWYDISDTALIWIRSFLINRFQSIKIRKCFSKAAPLFCGVPQGSVLGPLMFTLYTRPLSSLINSHKLDHHLYEDDISPKDIIKLQCAQNCFSHSVPLLKYLHWHPV